jgi:hypothetical protein
MSLLKELPNNWRVKVYKHGAPNGANSARRVREESND